MKALIADIQGSQIIAVVEAYASDAYLLIFNRDPFEAGKRDAPFQDHGQDDAAMCVLAAQELFGIPESAWAAIEDWVPVM